MGKRRKKNIYSGPNITEKHNFQLDQSLKLSIVEYDEMGVGKAFVKDAPVIVFNSIIGEEIEASILKIYPEKVIAKLVKIIKKSSDRIEPDCIFFGECTGCQWLHLKYEKQLKLKQDIVGDNLIRQKVEVSNLSETISSNKKIHYRNHGRFTVRKKELREEIGFVNFLERKWVKIDHCRIMNETINEKIKILSGNLSDKTQVSIRASDETSSYLIQPKFIDVDFETGQKYYTEKIFDNEYQVASPSFFQVNISQVENIFSELLDQNIFSKQYTVLDAYCGVGTFTCLIAPYVKKIVGIEESFSAVEDAKENSKKFSNIEYLLGKTEDILESYTENIDVLILDPPRIGCDEKVIKIIKDIKPKKIILISCSPENFAIDISRLIDDNIFSLLRVIPFDMFPQTRHVEVLGILDLLNE